MRGVAPDPAPDHDLQSDIVFRLWLSTLEVETVMLDLEPRPWTIERKYITSARDERDHPIR